MCIMQGMHCGTATVIGVSGNTFSNEIIKRNTFTVLLSLKDFSSPHALCIIMIYAHQSCGLCMSVSKAIVSYQVAT